MSSSYRTVRLTLCRWVELPFNIIWWYSGEKAMAPHSSTLAWKIPWMEEPRRLQSMGSLRVRHDWVTSLSLFPFMHWRRKWQPTPVFLPGESQGWGAWWAAIYGVTQGQTWLKRLSSRSSSSQTIFESDHTILYSHQQLSEPCQHLVISLFLILVIQVDV